MIAAPPPPAAAPTRKLSGGGESVTRSRAWSEDVTKTWNTPIKEGESLADRVARYGQYLDLTKEQLDLMFAEFVKEVQLGLHVHADAAVANGNKSGICSLKMLDTCVERIPSGEEKGISYALDFGGTNIRAVRTRLEGKGKLSISESKVNLRQCVNDYEKGLLDKKCGAIHLFDTLALTVKELMKKSGDLNKNTEMPVGFTFSFPAELRGLSSASLIVWTKGFETGRETHDAVEGMDVAQLLDVAFWRNNVNARCAAVANDTVGTLLACAYERPRNLPECTVGIILGTGVNGCYVEPNARRFGYEGQIINTELGGFDKGLPLTDVDLEVDFADDAGRGTQMFEKMVSGAYLGEICRRVVLKVWQNEAPAAAWNRQSLPAAAVALCVSDESLERKTVGQALQVLWDWAPPVNQRVLVQKLFEKVFFRSAGLAAVAVAGLAQCSNRLQPAMGGVTVAVDGSLYTQNEWYAGKLRDYLVMLKGKEVAGCVHILESKDGSGKGAAVLSGTLQAVPTHMCPWPR